MGQSRGRDPLFENKLAALLLFAALVIFTPPLLVHKLLSDDHHNEEKGPAQNDVSTAQAADMPDGVTPIAERLQNASATAGERAIGACKSCHSFAPDGQHGIGPNLYCVFDRRIGGAAGYYYSPALDLSDENWTAERLDAFLSSPQSAFPGTAMTFSVNDEDKRADIIVYLQSIVESGDSRSLCNDNQSSNE